MNEHGSASLRRSRSLAAALDAEDKDREAPGDAGSYGLGNCAALLFYDGKAAEMHAAFKATGSR